MAVWGAPWARGDRRACGMVGPDSGHGASAVPRAVGLVCALGLVWVGTEAPRSSAVLIGASPSLLPPLHWSGRPTAGAGAARLRLRLSQCAAQMGARAVERKETCWPVDDGAPIR